ncbi:MAG: signal peptidase II [Clostridia bacterium]|nr:signal peptidase II [Clostridia bacterium]
MFGIIITAIVAFILDRISKVSILKFVFGLDYPSTAEFGDTVPVFKDVFHLTYHSNTGMAFGMLAGNKGLLICICAVVLLVIGIIIYKSKPQKIIEKLCYGMIIGGAVGNVFDRISYGFVIDFLDFRIINYPIFNVADCFVVVGAIMLCVYILFFDKRKDEVGKN